MGALHTLFLRGRSKITVWASVVGAWLTYVPPGFKLDVGQCLVVTSYLLLAAFCIFDHPDLLSFPNRPGFIAVAQFPVLFLTAAKYNPLFAFIGRGHDKLNFLHRWVGRGVSLAVAVHAVFWVWKRFRTGKACRLYTYQADTTGIAATIVLAIIFIFKIAVRAGGLDNTFMSVSSHRLVSPTSRIPFRLSMRLVRASSKLSFLTVSSPRNSKLGNAPDTKHGHTDTEEQGLLTLAARVTAADLKSPIRVLVDGPYGTPPKPLGERVVMVCGGSGAAYIFGVLADWLDEGDVFPEDDEEEDESGSHQSSGPSCVHSILLIWYIREARCVRWFADNLRRIGALARARGVSIVLRICVTREQGRRISSEDGVDSPSGAAKDFRLSTLSELDARQHSYIVTTKSKSGLLGLGLPGSVEFARPCIGDIVQEQINAWAAPEVDVESEGDAYEQIAGEESDDEMHIVYLLEVHPLCSLLMGAEERGCLLYAADPCQWGPRRFVQFATVDERLTEDMYACQEPTHFGWFANLSTLAEAKLFEYLNRSTMWFRSAAEDDILPKGSVDPVYQAKAELLNAAIQEIGMGKYQWHLFIVTGFGWLADNLWPIVTGLILAPVVQEFNAKGPFLKLAQNIGLISFNTTLAIIGIFATVAAASPTFTALSVFAALWSVGRYILRISAGHSPVSLNNTVNWWAFGQLLGSLIAWPIISNYSCDATATTCARRDNMGWRYFLIAMGGLMIVLWFIRFFVFRLYESPKYLMGRGRFAEAVEVVHAVAKYNGKSVSLTTEELETAGVSGNHANTAKGIEEGPRELDTTARAALKRKFEQFNGDHVRSLFATRKMAISTSLVIAIWLLLAWRSR
ncbi:Sugar transporter, partial [Rhizoctonia solani]